jgi:hypothetical protein
LAWSDGLQSSGCAVDLPLAWRRSIVQIAVVLKTTWRQVPKAKRRHFLPALALFE